MTDQPPLSQQAQEGIQRPHYWRDVREVIVGEGGPEYEKAFFALQQEIDPLIEADKNNPFTKSKYASLGNILAHIRPLIHKHGFTIKQFCGSIRGHGEGAKKWFSLPVCTKFCHVESMQWEMVIFDLPIEGTAHSIAAATTYGKRYGPQGYFGMATADDDAMSFIRSRIDQEMAEEAAQGIIDTINECETEADLNKWLSQNEEGMKLLSETSIALVRTAYGERKAFIKKNPAKPIKEAAE